MSIEPQIGNKEKLDLQDNVLPIITVSPTPSPLPRYKL